MPAYHYTQKQISEVSPTDSRVSIMGSVVNAGDNSFILDDGTGKIEVSSEIPVGRNKLFRVFCSVIDEKLKADVVQDVEGLDVELFKKVKELYNSSGV